MHHANISIIILFLLLTSCGGGSNKNDSTADCNGKEYCVIYRSASALADADIDATGDSDGNGIEEADALCNAARPADTGYFKALIVDDTNRVGCTTPDCGTGGATEHIDWPLVAKTKYRQSNGTTTIGMTNDIGLFSFPLDNAASALGGIIFTGIRANYTRGENCGHWQIITGSGFSGSVSSSSNNVLYSGSTNCNASSAYLLCIEQ